MSVIAADTIKTRVVGAAVTTENGLNVGGACTATSFVGDGSSLTGIADTANVSTSTLYVVGVSTLSGFTTTGTDVYVLGALTATTFSGDGSALTGLANTDFILAEQLTVIGFATVSDTLKVGTAITAHAGIITATSYYGDASNMDNAGISAGKSVALAAFLGC